MLVFQFSETLTFSKSPCGTVVRIIHFFYELFGLRWLQLIKNGNESDKSGKYSGKSGNG